MVDMTDGSDIHVRLCSRELFLCHETPLDIVKKTGYRYYLNSFFPEKPTIGIEPMNLILTKDVLYQLSYMGKSRKSGQ